MSVRRLDPVQPARFKFTRDNLSWAKQQMKKYPKGKEASAVLPLLWRAQEQHQGWLPEPAIRYVADILGMAHIRVLEVATFYTMFNLSPVGRYHVQLCGTTPCWLRGADALKEVCRRLIGPQGHVTEDGLFSWIEVECLAACVNAPMAQINKDYFEDLTEGSFERILMDLKEGREVRPGPQVDRQTSAPIGGPTTLADRRPQPGGGAKSNGGPKLGGAPPKAAPARARRTKGTPANSGSVDVQIAQEKEIEAKELEEQKYAKPPLRYPKQKQKGKPGYDKPPVGAESKAWRTPGDDETKRARTKSPVNTRKPATKATKKEPKES